MRIYYEQEGDVMEPDDEGMSQPEEKKERSIEQMSKFEIEKLVDQAMDNNDRAAFSYYSNYLNQKFPMKENRKKKKIIRVDEAKIEVLVKKIIAEEKKTLNNRTNPVKVIKNLVETYGLDKFYDYVDVATDDHVIKEERNINEISKGLSDKAYRIADSKYGQASNDPLRQKKLQTQIQTFSDYLNPEIRREITNLGGEIVGIYEGVVRIKFNEVTISIDTNSYQFDRGDVSQLEGNLVRSLPRLIKKIQVDINSQTQKNKSKTLGI